MLSASAAELTARVPIGAVTGPVHVQTALGTATGPVFTVTTEQDVSFSASPAAVTVFQGSSSNVSLALASFGTKEFDGLMQLSVTGLPNGVTARFMPTHLARGQSGTLVLSAAASSPVVTNQDIVVTATNVSGGLVTARNATFASLCNRPSASLACAAASSRPKAPGSAASASPCRTSAGH